LRLGDVVSFQITILKVLAGHPAGRASLADLRRAVAILVSSGSDWTNRTKRLVAQSPGLDIFSQSFVLRDDAGWQITDAGRVFLASVETPIQMTAHNELPQDIVASSFPSPSSPPIGLVVVKSRRRPPRRRTRGDLARPHRFLALHAITDLGCRHCF
jgi:hypothetical protein